MKLIYAIGLLFITRVAAAAAPADGITALTVGDAPAVKLTTMTAEAASKTLAAIGGDASKPIVAHLYGPGRVSADAADLHGALQIPSDLSPGVYTLTVHPQGNGADTVLEVSVGTAASVTPPAAADAPLPALTPLPLTQPLSGKTVLVENMAIDATGMNRVVELQDNQTIVLRNCTITGAKSVIEGNAHNTTVTLDNVRVGVTYRYVLYLESRDGGGQLENDREYVTAIVSHCVFSSSIDETPIRMMAGSRLELTSSTVMDVFDRIIASDPKKNKAEQGLRLHCYSAYVANNVIGKWTKLGTAEDQGYTTHEIVSKNNTYDGGVYVHENLTSLNMDGDILDGSVGLDPYAYSGTKPPQCVMTNVKTIGKLGW